MRVDHHKDADVLFIRFTEDPVIESDEVADGIVVDYGPDDQVVGVELHSEAVRVIREALGVKEPA